MLEYPEWLYEALEKLRKEQRPQFEERPPLPLPDCIQEEKEPEEVEPESTCIEIQL